MCVCIWMCLCVRASWGLLIGWFVCAATDRELLSVWCRLVEMVWVRDRHVILLACCCFSSILFFFSFHSLTFFYLKLLCHTISVFLCAITVFLRSSMCSLVLCLSACKLVCALFLSTVYVCAAGCIECACLSMEDYIPTHLKWFMAERSIEMNQ